jgi:hypothetical protein
MKNSRFLLLVLFSAGCYQYGIAPSTVEPGTRVRATLTPSGAIRHSEETGRSERRIEGDLISLGVDTLALSIPRQGMDARYFRESVPTADTFRVPRLDVHLLEHRQLSRTRTGFVIGGIAVVSGFLVREAIEGAGGSSGPGPGGEGPIRAIISGLLLRIFRGPGR